MPDRILSPTGPVIGGQSTIDFERGYAAGWRKALAGRRTPDEAFQFADGTLADGLRAGEADYHARHPRATRKEST